MERPLEGLSRTLSQMRRREYSLMIVLVLPAGTFDSRRSEVEARLGALGDRFARANNLLITEDYVGGWTKLFSAPDGPSTHLINARGEFVWKQEGPLDGRAVAAALDERMLPAPAAHTAPLRLAVRQGDQMPDAVFTDEAGNHIAVRRLRGRHVLITFWKSWSAPSIPELQRLQRLQRQENPPLILAINGGEDRGVIAEVRGRHQLTFALIDDPQRSIATQYGVQCWPTTLSINSQGIIDSIQFGVAHAPNDNIAGA